MLPPPAIESAIKAIAQIIIEAMSGLQCSSAKLPKGTMTDGVSSSETKCACLEYSTAICAAVERSSGDISSKSFRSTPVFSISFSVATAFANSKSDVPKGWPTDGVVGSSTIAACAPTPAAAAAKPTASKELPPLATVPAAPIASPSRWNMWNQRIGTRWKLETIQRNLCQASPALANPFRWAAAVDAGFVAATPRVGKKDSFLNISIQPTDANSISLGLQPILRTKFPSLPSSKFKISTDDYVYLTENRSNPSVPRDSSMKCASSARNCSSKERSKSCRFSTRPHTLHSTVLQLTKTMHRFVHERQSWQPRNNLQKGSSDKMPEKV